MIGTVVLRRDASHFRLPGPTLSSMDAELEGWLSATVLPDFGTQVGYDDVALGFFRALYAERGPLAGEDLWTAALNHQLELAKDAVLALGSDVLATITDREIHLAPVVCGFVIRISCNGEFSSHDNGRMLAFGPSQALLEVATTVQDLVTEQHWMVWPECPQHERALLAERGRPPVWVCRAGPHPVAAIGELRAGQASAAAG